MTRRGLSIDLAGCAALALAAGSPALAQSAQDFRLPPGDSAPPAAGPVDPETPGASPTPAPSPTPLPRIVPPAPTATPTSPPPAAATPAAPRRQAPAAAAPAAVPAIPAVATPAPPATEASGSSTLPSEPAATEATPLPPAPEASGGSLPAWLWPALGGAAALLLLLALVIWRSRRTRATRLAAAEEWEEVQPAAPPTPKLLPPIPQPAFAPPPAAPPPPPAPAAVPAAASPASFELMLEPQRMTLAMINATLVYRLAVANRGTTPLGPLRITCDMISAHASLAAAEQLEPDPEKAWLSHEFEAIPPGETIMIDGELRLPRTEIRPVRRGSSSLFVPLARFTLQTLANGRPAPIGARVFVIGEEPEQPGGPVKPFRLNEGSRSYSRVSQREVVITG